MSEEILYIVSDYVQLLEPIDLVSIIIPTKKIKLFWNIYFCSLL